MSCRRDAHDPIHITAALVTSAFTAVPDDLDAWCNQVALAAETRLSGTRVGIAVYEPTRLDRLKKGWINDGVSQAYNLHEPLTETVCVAGAGADGVTSVLGTRLESPVLRVLAPVRETRTARTLALQIERADDATFPDWIEPVARAFGEGCASAYARFFALLAEHRADLMSSLSTLQRFIAPLLIEGRSESEVAEQLGRSRHTVHDHVKRIYRAWGVRSRMQMRDLWYKRNQALFSTR